MAEGVSGGDILCEDHKVFLALKDLKSKLMYSVMTPTICYLKYYN